VAGIPVRHPEMVALGRHYGCTVETGLEQQRNGQWR